MPYSLSIFFFFFNDTATTEIYTLSLHDALPISDEAGAEAATPAPAAAHSASPFAASADRKSTRLNSSHSQISYAVFCLKKKKKKTQRTQAYSANDWRIHNRTPTCTE